MIHALCRDLNKYVNRPPLARVRFPRKCFAFKILQRDHALAQVLAEYCWFVDRSHPTLINTALALFLILLPQKRAKVPRIVRACISQVQTQRLVVGVSKLLSPSLPNSLIFPPFYLRQLPLTLL